MLRNISITWRLVRGSLARLILSTLIGSSLAASLGLAYPVQRELDISAYTQASYLSSTQLVVSASQEPLLAQKIGTPNCFVTMWSTSFSKSGKSTEAATLFGEASDCDKNLSIFPESTKYTSSTTPGERWIDLNADAAQTIGAKPGDMIDVYLGKDIAPLSLTLRNIYAARPDGQFSGRTLASAMSQSVPDVLYGLLLSSETPANIGKKLHDPTMKSLLTAEVEPETISIGQLQDIASENSDYSLAIVATAGLLALLTGISWIIRESDVFKQSIFRTISVVHELGGDSFSILKSWLLLSSTGAIISSISGVLLGCIPYITGTLSPALPLTITPLLFSVVGCTSLAIVTFNTFWAFQHWRHLEGHPWKIR